MITTKNLIILVGVMVLLAAVSFMQKSQHTKAINSSSTAVVISGEFNLDNISRLSLGYGTDPASVVLASTAEGWVVESYHNARANEQRVTTLLRNFSNLTGEFRSDSGEVLSQYGLTDKQAVTVRGQDSSGAEVLALNLGRTPKGFPGQFMRTPDSNKVYLSQGGMLSHLGVYSEPEPPKTQFFLELQAISESAANVNGLIIADGDASLVLTKEFGMIPPAEGSPEGTPATVDRNTWQWLVDGQIDADLVKSKIDGVLNSAARIRANDVVDPLVPLAEYGLDNPARSLSLIRQDDSQVLLEFGNTREASSGVTAGTYMRIAGNPTIWLVTDYTIKNIFKSRDELKAE